MHAYVQPQPFSRLTALARTLRRTVAPVSEPRATPAAIDIPAAFSEGQALFVLALKELAIDRDEATWLMWAAPEPFTRSQAVCAAELLDLAFDELCATLADAMHPCALRGRLMRARDFEDEALCRLRRDIPLELQRVRRQRRPVEAHRSLLDAARAAGL